MKRKVLYIIGVLSLFAASITFCVLLAFFTGQEQTQREQQAAKELQLYTEFLEGKRSVDKWTIADLATVTGEPDKKEAIEYTMFDCDEDKLPELHVRTVKDYYIIDCNGEKLYAWKYLYPRTEILNNGDFLYTHIGDAPLHYDYKYFSVDTQGEDDDVIRFSCYDDNGDGIFDEKDLYLGEDAVEVTYKQWLKWEKKYLGVGTDEVKWKEININAIKPGEAETDVSGDQYADVENRYEELLQGTIYANWQDEPMFCFGDVIYIQNKGYQFASGKYYPNGERLTDYLPEEDREYLSGLLENNCLGTVLQSGNRLIYGRKQTTDEYRITIVEYPTGHVLKTCVLPGKVECVYGDRLYYQAERMNAEGEKRYHIEYWDCSDETNHVVYVSGEYPGQMMVREDGALAFATHSDGYFFATADNTLRKLHDAIEDRCWYAAEMFKRFDETGLYFQVEYFNHDVEFIRLCEDGNVYSRKSIAGYGEIPLADGVLYYKGTEGKFYPYEKGIVGMESEFERIKRELKAPMAEYLLLNSEYSEAGYRPLMHLQRKDTILWFWHNGEDIVITDEIIAPISVFKEVYDFIEKQRDMCAMLEGEWYFEKYYLPQNGAPSKELAEDYMNERIRFSYVDQSLVSEFRGDTYEMVSVRPVEKFYLRNGYAYSGGAEQEILNGYTCEMLFESSDRSMLVYINETGQAFLRIGGDVAENACFVMGKEEDSVESNVVELPYFQDKTEELAEKCRLYNRYHDLEIVAQMIEEHEDIFIGEDICVEQEGQNVSIQVNGQKLFLQDVEEVMGLSVDYMFVFETLCRGNEMALLYRFSNEEYSVQIMETTKGRHYIRIYFANQDAYNVYVCSDVENKQVGSLKYSDWQEVNGALYYICLGENGNELMVCDMQTAETKKIDLGEYEPIQFHVRKDGAIGIWTSKGEDKAYCFWSEQHITYVPDEDTHKSWTYLRDYTEDGIILEREYSTSSMQGTKVYQIAEDGEITILEMY